MQKNNGIPELRENSQMDPVDYPINGQLNYTFPLL